MPPARVRSAALAVLLAAASAGRAEPRRPNIVLISLDTLRADRLSVYGNPRPTTPEIDRLARGGVVFDAAFSHSPKTAPSHMSLFTGLLPPAHDVYNVEDHGPGLGPGVPTLAQLLHGAGYRTLAFTPGGQLLAELGFDRGFERYEYTTGFEPAFEAAGDAVEGLAGDPAPYFLFVHTYRVHDPYTPPADLARQFVDPGYRGRIVADREALRAAAGDGADYFSVSRLFWSAVRPDDPADRRHLLDLYDACLRHADILVGRLIARLEALDPNLLVVVLADHGEEFYEHGGTRHNTMYDEVLHVPLIVRWPPGDRMPPRRVADTVRLVDVLPTLLERAGVEPPAEHHGRSLFGLASGAREAPRPSYGQWHGLESLRADGFKLVRRGRLADELYDLSADPGERVDLVRERPDLARALAERMQELAAPARRFRAAHPPGRTPKPDPATVEQLRALGYVH